MITLSALHIYPIKSCAGIGLSEVVIDEPGFAMDRRWMLVDQDGRFLSQRDCPAMATITAMPGKEALIVHAPGMAALSLPLQPSAAAERISVVIWNDTVQALDGGAEAHRWFSSYLDMEVRLVCFDPEAKRVCSARWTGDIVATTQFSDGFPLLLIGEASLHDLNRRLQNKGAPALPMDRFRPNLVLAGLEAYEEDYLDTVTLGEPGREVVIKIVKPCARCPIPGIDQRTGLSDARWPHEPLDTLAAYRANARVGGGLVFGQNAIVVAGLGNLLQVGQAARCELNF